MQFERKLYVVRKRAETEVRESGHAKTRRSSTSRRSPAAPSSTKACCSRRRSRTSTASCPIPDVVSALCLVHQRFSTNTFPTWQLAHPYRYIAHNGEINTLRGNVNWMHARQSMLESPLFGDDIKKLFPDHRSRTAAIRRASTTRVELLLQAGRSLPHAMAMLIPEAWAGNPHMKPEKRAFYEYHASLMEPWDGPAAIAFTDGRVDRRHARPQRPAPGALPGHARRSGGHGVGNRRACRSSPRT